MQLPAAAAHRLLRSPPNPSRALVSLASPPPPPPPPRLQRPRSSLPHAYARPHLILAAKDACAARAAFSTRSTLAAPPSPSPNPTPSPQRPPSPPPPSTSSPSPTWASASAAVSLVQSRDRVSSLASHFYPRPLQRHFLAIRAFNVELASVKENVSSELLGRIRIGWWRDAVRSAFDNRPAKHPIVLALRDAIHDPVVQRNGGLVEDHFLKIIDAREADLSSPTTPPTLDSLETYAERTSSRLHYLSLNLVGVSDPLLDELFSHLGKASGLALLLVSLPFHAGLARVDKGVGSSPRHPTMSQSQRRLVLPSEYLARHGVVEEDVYRSGPQAKGLRDAVFDTATRANDYLITARTMIRDEFGGKAPAAVVGPLVHAVATRTLLERLESLDFDVFDERLHADASARGWRVPWAMWKASWSRSI